MANVLTLVQVSPSSNPDRMICSVAVSGDYTNGTPDPLPLAAIADPGAIGRIPLPGVATNPPAAPPKVFGFLNGYSAQVQKTVANGQTSFGLRWFAPGGAEVATGPFPGGLLAGLQLFLEILVDLFQQS